MEEPNRVRIHGALFDEDELEALVLRICAGMGRIQPELRIDAWALCRRMERRIEELGGTGVRVHPYLFPDDPTIYVLSEKNEEISQSVLRRVAQEFVINEDLLRVLAYQETDEPAPR